MEAPLFCFIRWLRDRYSLQRPILATVSVMAKGQNGSSPSAALSWGKELMLPLLEPGGLADALPIGHGFPDPGTSPVHCAEGVLFGWLV